MPSLDFTDFRPRPSGSPPYRVGDWLEIRVGDETRIARLCHIGPKSGRMLFCNPDAKLALAVHPVILEHQLRADEARVAAASSLFEAAAGVALRQVARN